MLDDLANVRDELWRRGELRWKLRPYQEEFYDTTWAFLRGRIESRKLFEDCHRRYGKSFGLFTIGTEIGLGKACRGWPERKRVIRFAAPTMLDLEEIYHPIADDLFDDCPDDLRPVWRTSRGRGHFYFPSTDSQLYLFGVDAHHFKKGRGKKCHLGVVDEAGTCEPACEGGVRGFVNSILLPQTFGIDGCIVIATTPPETPAHPAGELKAQCQAAGAYIRRTLDDTATFFGEQVVEEYARECGGRDTTAFRREYLCEWIVDEERAVVPEATDDRMTRIVREPEVPRHFFPLVAMDVGFEDWHAILFGYWDFASARLVVQDEAFLRRATTDQIATAIRAKEAELWPWLARETVRGADGFYEFEPWRDERKRALRYSDTDLRLIHDLSVLHTLPFAPTAKDEKEAQINELRQLVRSERIVISPRCEILQRHVRMAVWNKARSGFERTSAEGHFDGVDALVYMLRNAPRNRNPVPAQPVVQVAGIQTTRARPRALNGNAATVASIYGRR